VRGEEYSAQIDHFVKCIREGKTALTSFRTASDTTLIANMMREDAAKPLTEIAPAARQTTTEVEATEEVRARARKRTFLGRLLSADEA